MLANSPNQHDQSCSSLSLFPFLADENFDFDEKLMTKFLEFQEQHIETLTESIKVHNEPNDLEALRLLNERGVVYFLTGQMDNAINDFNFVISTLESTGDGNEFLGTALWCRMLCHAFNDQFNETHEDSLQILSFFNVCNQDSDQLDSSNEEISLILPVKFAHPDEIITEYECHDRVKTIGGIMRSLNDRVPNYLVREIVHATINKLSSYAHDCCDSGKHWTKCLGPIDDARRKLRDTWDTLVELFNKGISIDKFLTAPYNL